LRAVADRVARAFASMDACASTGKSWRGARQSAILLRVDVQLHHPPLVAADLGLSIRQFHRERRLAHDRFLDEYRAVEFASPHIKLDQEFATRLLASAAGLADSGETSSARAILEDIAGSGGDAAARCEALSRLAEIEAWSHHLDFARANLAASNSVLIAAALPAGERRRLQDIHNAVELCLCWFAEGPTGVNRDRAGDRAKTGSNEAPLDVRATLVRAAAAIRSGESAHAARLLQRFDREAATKGAEATVDFLTLRAELADFNAEDPQVSETFLGHAIDIASTHGLGGRELYARHQLYSARWMHSRSAPDRDAYRRLVDRTDRSLPPRLRSSLAFCSADIEVAIGHPQRALQSAEEAAAVSTNAYERMSARGLAAAALLRLGRVADAGLQAAAAAEPARLAGHARVLSLAQRISALAYLAQGNRRAARYAIEEALECARRFSSAHVLRQAQSVLGRVTAR
jgi:hypothetical protein